MRPLALLGVALTLASCARSERPDWMVGTWAFQRPAALNGPDRCTGGSDPRAYNRDGHYLEIDAAEYGRWEMKGKRLIHHILRVRGRPVQERDSTNYIFRIDARAPDRIDVNRGPDEQMTMLRCGRDADLAALERRPAPAATPPASR